MRFVNVIYFTSAGCKLGVCCLKMALWCRDKMTTVMSCTVCAFSWYIKWREAWNVNDWFTAAWGLILFYIEKWKSFLQDVKME